MVTKKDLSLVQYIESRNCVWPYSVLIYLHHITPMIFHEPVGQFSKCPSVLQGSKFVSIHTFSTVLHYISQVPHPFLPSRSKPHVIPDHTCIQLLLRIPHTKLHRIKKQQTNRQTQIPTNNDRAGEAKPLSAHFLPVSITPRSLITFASPLNSRTFSYSPLSLSKTTLHARAPGKWSATYSRRKIYEER